ncbi:MAG: hypothetical protein K0U86_07555 [Planctomycetes bacterium]|nr:hypothetical protein [Planctomycetota bacterium]MCH9724744.1 hypothetical protein [Planctomycetota bacterium]MCH9778810.1 hypothetical protein [Planctomycetota bacterium]MCH9791607.1 hypothetical protein [Planctomycetota bacterium]
MSSVTPFPCKNPDSRFASATTAVPEPLWEKQDLKVPRYDDAIFARPDLSQLISDAEENRRMFAACSRDRSGKIISSLRTWARQAVMTEAAKYTSELTGKTIELPQDFNDRLLLITGHQPALYHPGVWVKNLLIGNVARKTAGLSLNLIVDNDLVSSTSIRVPQGTRSMPTFSEISFDESIQKKPWEDTTIQNKELFQSFAERVDKALKQWPDFSSSLLPDIWPAAISQMNSSDRLADCLAAARHAQEQRWGIENLELPISRLCATSPFLWFASFLFQSAEKFRAIHNEVLDEYRKVNRVRSKTHPVPELSEQEGWIESPFWMWRAGETRRHQVFVKRDQDHIQISDGKTVIATLPMQENCDLSAAIEILKQLPDQGIRLRTRALTTTLFARLFLGDLFVHGIGGAKYDEMTDRIFTRFFHLMPPRYLTLSATKFLPFCQPYDVQQCDETCLKGVLRDLDFNSDRHLTNDQLSDADSLLKQKKALIQDQQSAETDHDELTDSAERRRRNRHRFRELREVDAKLARLTAKLREQINEDLTTVRQQINANAVIQSREMSFVLYPEPVLKELFDKLSREVDSV